MNDIVIRLESKESALTAIHRASCIVGLLGNVLPVSDEICTTMVGSTLLEAESLMLAAHSWFDSQTGGTR